MNGNDDRSNRPAHDAHAGDGARQAHTAAQGNGARHEPAFQDLAEVALRGTALLFDLQLEVARNVWQAQARTAAMLGAPDVSNLFGVSDERARRLFSTSAEQIASTMRQATETMGVMQRQLSRLAERQTIGISDEIRMQIAQLGQRTEHDLQALERIGQRGAEAASRATDEWQGAMQRAQGEARQEGQAAEQRGAQQRDSVIVAPNEPIADQRNAGEGERRERARRPA